MQEIRLLIEKLNDENFEDFIVLLKDSDESDRGRCPDNIMISRLREDAFSTNPKYEAYLGKIGLEWVAYLITTMSYSTFSALPGLTIDDIYVLDDFRELGIGKAMFEFCVRKARKRGCGSIEVAVPARNRIARKFFESNGAVPVDMSCYRIGLLDTKIGKPRKRKFSRLHPRVNKNHQLFAWM